MKLLAQWLSPRFHWLLWIPRVAVIQIKRKSLWVLCMSHMWRVFQRSWNVEGIDVTLGWSSKLSTLGVYSWKPGSTVHLQYFLWMWQKLHWRNRQTSSHVTLWTQAQSPSLQQGILEKSKLTQCAYEEGCRVGWDDAKILEIESNSRCRKMAHMACLSGQISQPSLDISPIQIPLINSEASKLQRRSVWYDRFL
jgi:hypothetical protein